MKKQLLEAMNKMNVHINLTEIANDLGREITENQFIDWVVEYLENENITAEQYIEDTMNSVDWFEKN